MFLKSTLAFILTLSFIFPSQFAFAQDNSVRVEQAAKDLIQDVQYRLSVEWDGVDQQEYNKIFADFQTELDLLKDQGLSKEKLEQSMMALIVDPVTKEEFSHLLKILDLSNDPNEIQEMYFTQLLNSQPTGSHWMGDVDKRQVLWITLGVIAGVAYFAYGGYCIFHPDRGTDQEPKMCVPLTNFLDHM